MGKRLKDLYRSVRWLKFRDEILRRDGYKCTVCGSKEDLTVHHLSYDDFFNPNSVITLCRSCHMKVHGIMATSRGVRTGSFIKRFLLKHGEGYPYQVYQELKKIKLELGLNPGSYQNIRNYFYWLERLGLIERTRRVEVEQMKISGETDRRGRGLRPRGRPVYYQYYRLTEKGRREKEAWMNPRKALYER